MTNKDSNGNFRGQMNSRSGMDRTNGSIQRQTVRPANSQGMSRASGSPNLRQAQSSNRSNGNVNLGQGQRQNRSNGNANLQSQRLNRSNGNGNLGQGQRMSRTGGKLNAGYRQEQTTARNNTSARNAYPSLDGRNNSNNANGGTMPRGEMMSRRQPGLYEKNLYSDSMDLGEQVRNAMNDSLYGNVDNQSTDNYLEEELLDENIDGEDEKEENKVMKNIEEIFKVDKDNKKISHNNEMSKVVLTIVIVFVGMFAYMGYFLMVSSKDVVNTSENRHAKLLEKTIKRGSILDRNGNVLAETKSTDNDTSQRVYPYGSLYAHLVGVSSSVYNSGFEVRFGNALVTSNQGYLTKLVNEIKKQKSLGDNIVLTVDTDVQKAADAALSKYERGAAIAMDPDTGEVIAMYSKPGFDPNKISEEFKELNQRKDSPFTNRVTMGTYPPGSTFKLITTLGYLRQNNNNIDSYSYTCTGTDEESGLNCFGKTAHGKETLKESVYHSCNTSLANVGKQLKLKKFSEDVNSVFIGTGVPYRYGEPYKGQFKLKDSDNIKMKAQTFIGQGETLITPLHNAMITCAIANGGYVMQPKILSKIESASGKVISEVKNEKSKEIMTKQETDILSDFMKAVVDKGTAAGKFTSNKYEVRGKTGSAEINEARDSHAWFTGFAKGNNGKRIVVTVIVEKGGIGGQVATVVARQMYDAYFK